MTNGSKKNKGNWQFKNGQNLFKLKNVLKFKITASVPSKGRDRGIKKGKKESAEYMSPTYLRW